jgi:hypothetical protein
LGESVLGQRLLHACEVVAHQERLAGLGEVVDLIGGIVIALHRAFEMGDEGRAFDGEVVVVVHGFLLSSCLCQRPFRLSLPGLTRQSILLIEESPLDGCAGQARA